MNKATEDEIIRLVKLNYSFESIIKRFVDNREGRTFENVTAVIRKAVQTSTFGQ